MLVFAYFALLQVGYPFSELQQASLLCRGQLAKVALDVLAVQRILIWKRKRVYLIKRSRLICDFQGGSQFHLLYYSALPDDFWHEGYRGKILKT